MSKAPITTQDSINQLKECLLNLNMEEHYGEHGLEELFSSSKKTAIKTLLYRDIYQQVTNAFSDIIVLKGLSLTDSYYDGQPIRPFSDLDLLVQNKKTYEKLRSFLLQQGFIQSLQTTKLSSHKNTFVKYSNNIDLVVEVHSKLYGHLDFFVNEFSIYENLLYLTYHLAYQHNFLRLIWLSDLYLIYQKETISFAVLKEKASHYKLTNSLKMTTYLLNHYFNANLPITSKWYYRFLFSRSFLRNPKGNLIRYHLIKILSKDRLYDSFKYYFIWIFEKIKLRV